MLLLLAVLLLSHWLQSEIAWILISATLAWHIVKNGLTFCRPAVPVLAWLGVLGVLGLRGFVSHPIYDVVKDAWYFSKPIVEIAFGCWIAWRYGTRRALVVFVWAAAIVSVEYIGYVLWNLSKYISNDTYANRMLCGPGSFLSLIAVLLILEPSHRAAINSAANKTRSIMPLVVALSVAAILLSRSRTTAVLLIAFMGFWCVFTYRRLRRIVIVGGAAALVLLSTAAALNMFRTSLSAPEIIANSVIEMMPDEYESAADINTNWRGFESFLAIQEFDAFGAVDKLLGGGFGQMVQLDMIRELGGGAGGASFEQLPILHNGFLYVLIKTGGFGLIVFGLALRSLWRILAHRARTTSGLAWQVMPLWFVAAWVLSSGVITGPFNYSEMLCINIFIGIYISSLYGLSGSGAAIVEHALAPTGNAAPEPAVFA